MAVIDLFILKDRCVVIPETLQKQALEQLHINHMGTGKKQLLACKSIYWTGMTNDIENHKKIALHVFNFQQMHPNEKNNSP